MIDVSTASGIDVATISVERQLPRNSRIMSAVRHAAMTASVITPSMAARTNSDWSFRSVNVIPGGSVAAYVGSMFLICHDRQRRRGTFLVDRHDDGRGDRSVARC